jgi:3D-(3,5/4)-trihydroxycyclohexane-1,2-dione acylhydrolase (decyclizing)
MPRRRWKRLSAALGDYSRRRPDAALKDAGWRRRPLTAAPDGNELPTDAEVIGAVQRGDRRTDRRLCAAGTMPGELHKLWKAARPGGYHMEYGYSCMGYEIAGAMGRRWPSPIAT